ncbi:SAM-dependent methyltransferase [Actinomadura soli]|uniref:SAM-dependent methyltransferase n=1 Tax=Actinomadura soli TaxID=2508997 RepID=A0A5C4JKF5_9ACTN|nr:SAM-dependent methyltransferase [Actinomadura soli]TMR07370.1 SAM-dependent methyltransferase [Actinomadura soli]
MDDPPAQPPEIDTSVPHQARVWNYFIGGKDNYPVDRVFAENILRVYPGFEEVPRHARVFLGRAVRFLAGEAGIRQFLDIGTGLPTHDNTHEVAQRVAPDSRIVYVDNDPLVLAHARALLTSTPEGACDYIDADARDPAGVLLGASATLDFTEPVALMILGVLGTVSDDGEAHAILRQLLDALPPGSYLVLEDGTKTVRPDAAAEAERIRDESGYDYELRTPERIARFFDGLELLEPGVVSVSRWRPEPNPFGEAPEVDAFCGVARKP